MLYAVTLIAENAPQNQDNSGGGGLLGSPFLMFLPILVLAYFFLMRPMRQEEKKRQALISALKKNDKVVTSGGIIGVVASIKEKEDEVTLKVDEGSNTRIRVTKSSIVRVVTDEPAKDQKEGGS
jgi:preprotein translocase subunit YajC